jgi:hypothetical protein
VSSAWTRAAIIWLLLAVPYFGGLALLIANTGGLGSSLNIPGTLFVALVYGVFAGVLISRLPRHPITWLFAFCAGVSAVHILVGGLLEREVTVVSGPSDAAPWLAAFESVLWIPQVWAIFAIAFLFPDGKLPSTRWRPVFLLVTAWLGTAFLMYGSLSGPIELWPMFENPIGLSLLPVDFARSYAGYAFAGGAVLSFVSALSRFRSARGETRAQLKWFAFAAGSVAVGVVPAALLYFAPPPFPIIAILIGTVAVGFFLPVAIAIAVLRYRLYDIDVLIRRSLTYAAVSAVLAITYVAAVVLTGSALRPLIAGSDLAVAASTLLVVALFQPIRTRVQGIIDHRFYRARYDAARTLDAFSARLRNEVELDAVRADLLGAVGETVRPTHASVWLRVER